MEGFRDRLILTLRFIYDFNFIYLLFILVTTIISLVLFLGHDGEYELLQIWYQIIGLYRENKTSYFIQIIIIPIYNYLDWLLSGKYQVLPKLITKLIKGRMSLILKTSITFLVMLYLTSLFVGIYVTNQEEKAAEEARIAKEIQRKKKEKAAEEARIAKIIKLKREAEEARLAKEIQRKKEEEKKKEEQERIERLRIYRTTYPYQGLSCRHVKRYSGESIEEDIFLILKRNNDKTIYEVDVRTSDRVLDGVIYDFITIPNSSIKLTEAEIEISHSYRHSYNLSRSSLKLYSSNYNDNYQCIQVDYEYLYDFVKKHNATITDKNKL